MSQWVGDGDPATLYREPRVRARKEHICGACRETIAPGHVYVREVTIFEGTADTVKRCLRCQAIHEHLRTLMDFEEWPDPWLACGHEYEELHGEPPPPEIAELAFISAEEMQARARAGVGIQHVEREA